jgi:hypothetical protein
MKNCKVEISTNGSTWTDVGGFSNTIEVDGGDRETEGTSTFDGDTKIVTAGKRNPLTVKLKVVYTEGVSDPVEVARAAYENATPLYIRWSPKGGTTGNFQYYTDAGFVKNPVLPAGDSSSAEAVLVEINLETPKYTKILAA